MPGVGEREPGGEWSLSIADLQLSLPDQCMLIESAVVQMEPQRVPVMFARHPEAKRLVVAGARGVFE